MEGPRLVPDLDLGALEQPLFVQAMRAHARAVRVHLPPRSRRSAHAASAEQRTHMVAAHARLQAQVLSGLQSRCRACRHHLRSRPRQPCGRAQPQVGSSRRGEAGAGGRRTVSARTRSDSRASALRRCCPLPYVSTSAAGSCAAAPHSVGARARPAPTQLPVLGGCPGHHAAYIMLSAWTSCEGAHDVTCIR